MYGHRLAKKFCILTSYTIYMCICNHLLSCSVSEVRWYVLSGVRIPNECSLVPPSSMMPLKRNGNGMMKNGKEKQLDLRDILKIDSSIWFCSGQIAFRVVE